MTDNSLSLGLGILYFIGASISLIAFLEVTKLKHIDTH
jgi:hypothetical protein